MTTIKTWTQRCEEHPDHNGIVSDWMVQARMKEEIADLRAALEHTPLTRDDIMEIVYEHAPPGGFINEDWLIQFARRIEQKILAGHEV